MDKFIITAFAFFLGSLASSIISNSNNYVIDNEDAYCKVVESVGHTSRGVQGRMNTSKCTFVRTKFVSDGDVSEEYVKAKELSETP